MGFSAQGASIPPVPFAYRPSVRRFASLSATAARCFLKAFPYVLSSQSSSYSCSANHKADRESAKRPRESCCLHRVVRMLPTLVRNWLARYRTAPTFPNRQDCRAQVQPPFQNSSVLPCRFAYQCSILLFRNRPQEHSD